MSAVTFDTLEYSKTLQDAGMPQKQAEAIVTAQKKAVQDVVNAQQFVTKGDIYAVKADLQAVRTELKEDIQSLESKLETKIADTKHELIKWMFAFFIAQSALMVGVLAFVK